MWTQHPNISSPQNTAFEAIPEENHAQGLNAKPKQRANIINSHRLLITSGLLATTVAKSGQTFRLSDVSFFINLLANWVRYDHYAEDFKIDLTQLRRYIEEGIQKGQFISPVDKTYQMTFQGYESHLQQLLQTKALTPLEIVTLIFCLLVDYKEPLRTVMTESAGNIPLHSKERLEQLIAKLSPKHFITEQIKLCTKFIDELEIRIKGHKTTISQAKDILKTLKDSKQELHPNDLSPLSYGLESERPLASLFSNLSKNLVEQELKMCFERRSKNLFGNLHANLTQRLSYLGSLLEQVKNQ